jgi:hypothetical protein
MWIVQSDAFSALTLNQFFYQLPLDDQFLAVVHDMRERTFLGFARFDVKDLFVTARTTVVPHWFLVTLCAGLGSLSWLPWSNRFGLRTLLLTMTLVAVVLAICAARR